MTWRCDGGCGQAQDERPALEVQRPICRHYMRFCASCGAICGVADKLQLAKPCDTCAERAQRNGGSK